MYFREISDYEMGFRLLGQMRPHSADEQSNVRLLHNLILLSSKDKQDVELAVNDLTNLASQENLRYHLTPASNYFEF